MSFFHVYEERTVVGLWPTLTEFLPETFLVTLTAAIARASFALHIQFLLSNDNLYTHT